MTMKFVSKSSNYMIVLRPGIPGNILTGQAGVPGLSVRFRDGVVEVKDESTIELMLASSGFANQEFIAVDEGGEDPFSHTRRSMEPAHIVQEIQYGHITGRKVTEEKQELPPAIQKLITDEATRIATQMAPTIAKAMLENMAAEADKEQDKPAATAPAEASEVAAPAPEVKKATKK